MLRLDHLVVAARDLESGSRWLEQQLGVSLAPGGQHLAMGTHNRLLRLGEQLYLELIAIDPTLPAPSRPRWFGLDGASMRQRLAEGPQLIHWVAASEDIQTDAARAGFSASEILSMSRGDFRWRITVPADGQLPGGGLQPTLIQWDVPFHPAQRLPESGCRLMKLEAFTPHAPQIAQANTALGLGATIDLQAPSPGSAAEWVAYLETPCGLVEIAGRLDV